MVRPRIFRPFPAEQIVEACKGAKAVAVFDRSDSLGAAHGPLALEVRSAFQAAGMSTPVNDYIVGLGGADVTLEHVQQVFDQLEQRVEGTYDGALNYLGIEE